MSGSSSPTLPAAVVVRVGFGEYARGQIITDASVIKQLYEDGQHQAVVAIHPDAAEATVLDAKHAAAHAEPTAEEH